MNSIDSPIIATQTGALIATTTGVTASMQRSASMLNSSFAHIVEGNYTLYLSDILSIGGFSLSIVGVCLTLYRLLRKPNS